MLLSLFWCTSVIGFKPKRPFLLFCPVRSYRDLLLVPAFTFATLKESSWQRIDFLSHWNLSHLSVPRPIESPNKPILKPFWPAGSSFWPLEVTKTSYWSLLLFVCLGIQLNLAAVVALFVTREVIPSLCCTYCGSYCCIFVTPVVLLSSLSCSCFHLTFCLLFCTLLHPL